MHNKKRDQDRILPGARVVICENIFWPYSDSFRYQTLWGQILYRASAFLAIYAAVREDFWSGFYTVVHAGQAQKMALLREAL